MILASNIGIGEVGAQAPLHEPCLWAFNGICRGGGDMKVLQEESKNLAA